MAQTRVGQAVETIVLRVGALLISMVLFGIFVWFAKVNPFLVFQSMYKGAFGSWFSFQNSLQRAAPLILTALCTALPAQLGMVVIGAEGALLMGGLSAAAVAMLAGEQSPWTITLLMAAGGAIGGGIWIMIPGALRYFRGVNETISSLLLNYIAIAILNHVVEGPLRDPESLNKPSTPNIGDANMIGSIPGTDVHWGLVIGIAACIVMYVFIHFTTIGFSVRVSGGNPRAARLVGLSVGTLSILMCFLAGAAAGTAGMIEVAAVQGCANASLIAGYGYTGILVSFIARHNPLSIIPVAILFGGISASSGLLQRNHGLPDATVLVLQGLVFIVILISESLIGKFRLFQTTVAEKPVVVAKEKEVGALA